MIGSFSVRMEKFTFNRDFRADRTDPADTVVARRQARSAKVEEAHAQGYAEGRDDAVAEAERRSADALEVIADLTGQLLNTVNMELDQARDDATRLGAHIASRFVKRLVAQQPEGFLEQAVDACLEIARREPALRIELPADQVDGLTSKLNDLVDRNGLTGKVQIIASQQMSGPQCSLDWNTGGACVSLDETLEQIEKVIEEQIVATQMSRAHADTSEDRQIA